MLFFPLGFKFYDDRDDKKEKYYYLYGDKLTLTLLKTDGISGKLRGRTLRLHYISLLGNGNKII